MRILLCTKALGRIELQTFRRGLQNCVFEKVSLMSMGEPIVASSLRARLLFAAQRERRVGQVTGLISSTPEGQTNQRPIWWRSECWDRQKVKR